MIASSQNEVYKYPDVWVCLYNFYGCDSQDLEKECAVTANNTEGGLTRAVYHPGGEHEQEIPTSVMNSQEVKII